MVLASDSVPGIEPHRTQLLLSAVANRVGPLGDLGLFIPSCGLRWELLVLLGVAYCR